MKSISVRKKSDLTRGSTWHTNTLNEKSEDHAPIKGLPDGLSSWNLVGVTAGINTERMTPILSESEQVLKMANFCSFGDRSKIWPRPIFPKFTADLDIDPLNWFGTVKTYEIDFRPKKSDLTRGSTWHTNTLNAKSEDHCPQFRDFQTANHPWNLVGSLLGINTERMTPILKESEQVLKMANFCSIWPGG